jgi:quercetin dioxygenase-like cupin family protein
MLAERPPSEEGLSMPDLTQLAREHLEAARVSEHGRSADRILHDRHLRQSIIALTAGTELSEHNSPPAASIQVLQGAVRVTGNEEAEVSAGELAVLAHRRHSVVALEDSVFLLTTVTGLDDEQAHSDPS